jgi:hypothetical protein
MALNLSPGIVTNGLIFNYDMYNKQKSFKGVPTTNLISGAAAFSGWSNYWRTDYINTFTTEFGTTGYRITGNPSWNGVYTGISLPSTGTYTFSVWIRYWGGTSSNNGGVVYVSGWGGGDSASGIDKSLIGVWQRASITLNCTNTSMTFYIISYGGDSSGRADCSTWDITMPQVESGSFATGFVDGTRSNTQALVDLTNNNTITATSLTYATDGTFSFNGSSHLSIPNSDAFNTTSGLTIEAWVKFDGNSDDFIFEKGDVNTQYSLFSHSTDIVFRTYHSGDGGYHTQSPEKSAVGISNGVWVHIVGSWDGYNKRIFVNGELKNEVAKGGALVTTTKGASVGRFGGDTVGYYFNGSIAKVAIYNRGLTASEVLQNFNALRGRYGL